ncbi:YihY/virulence factor BrkB family protein [Aurantiacibacter sp. MUD11]|uniref:YihY/virulence factor BrkB family protein n=1 Tax=Aurantiacibacter sp. MUD11 TaxID=3003265 RepID=UPI0022AB409B|nr:YihY/virulence factor BrkB family protein [Aurantiacibacter sp. MUD11]WAT17239.1 YihY/virulence factor BrkB family protein [Aurantiacibacter sp. MUD11]
MALPGISDEDEKPGPPLPDLSPEARRHLAMERPGALARLRGSLGRGERSWEVVKRVAIGCFNDGTIHAGNLAYMSVLAIFPFFILAAAVFSAIGEEGERAATINAILTALPPVVGEVIGPVARNVVEARSGWLLWVGALVGLWTVGSLVETIRDILRRAYGTEPTQAFWKYRVLSTGIIMVAVLLLLTSFLAQVTISAAQQVIEAYFPDFTEALGQLAWSRIVPAFGLYFSIWMLFIALTPAMYRHRRYPKWPGALLVTVWWISVTLALPPVLRLLFTYNLTYGSLAGFMIVLFFFWLVGLGMVAGAELNAALAETPEEERERLAAERGEIEAGKETSEGKVA